MGRDLSREAVNVELHPATEQLPDRVYVFH